MNYLDKGHTIKETAELFEVGTTTIKEWKKLRAETGSLEHRPHKRKSTKICPARLVAYINEYPDSFLIEIAEVFNCTPQAVFYAFKRLGITRKKTVSYVEKCNIKRAEFIETIDSYPQHKLYYIDECGLDSYLYRMYGYAPRGVPVTGTISGKKYKRTNVVAAKNCDKIIAPMAYDGTTDCVLFEYWFEHVFLKSIPQYSVAIMDNTTFHRKKGFANWLKEQSVICCFYPLTLLTLIRLKIFGFG